MQPTSELSINLEFGAKSFRRKLEKQGVTEKPTTAIVLGSGLEGFLDSITSQVKVNFTDLDMPGTNLNHHAGEYVYGKLETGEPVIAVNGRYHYYAGFSSYQISYPIRLLSELGVNNFILTCAAGGLTWGAGNLMLVKDHLYLFPENPLKGIMNSKNLHPDPINVYDKDLRRIALEEMKLMDIQSISGVLAGVQGPNLETPAEYKMLKIIGADAVTMSTLPEALTVLSLGKKALAIAIITDFCFCDYDREPTTLEEILKVAKNTSEGMLFPLLKRIIPRIQGTSVATNA